MRLFPTHQILSKRCQLATAFSWPLATKKFFLIDNKEQKTSSFAPNNMFRFFMSSEQRKLSAELAELDLLTDTLPLKLQDYQIYFRQLVVIEPNLTKHIELLSKQKLTPIRFVKVLVFLHCWLQATCLVEQPQPVLNFINHLFKELGGSIEKTKKARTLTELKMSRPQVWDKSGLRFQQMELSKELFLMEDVVKPFLYYLQKLIANFNFYNTLKKNFIRPMAQSEIWVLVNLFHNIEKVTNNVSPICKFIRKSYRPVAEALALTFSQDISNLYPKLYKYSYGSANKIKNQYLDSQSHHGQALALQKSSESIDELVNLMVEIRVINKALVSLYEEPAIHNLENIYIPKVIDTEGREFEFILHLEQLKQENQGQFLERLTTPKFTPIQSEAEKLDSFNGSSSEEEEQLQKDPIFRDITNEDDSVVTFRKENFNFKGVLKKARKQSEEDEPKIANSYQLDTK